MSTNPKTLNIEHHTDKNRFVVVFEGQMAVMNYEMDGDTIIFTYTGVPAVMEGQGIGSCLVKEGLDYARAHSLKVASRCSFVDSYLERYPEYQDLLK